MPNREIMCESGTGQCDGHITNATVPCAVKRHITYLDNTHTLVHDISDKFKPYTDKVYESGAIIETYSYENMHFKKLIKSKDIAKPKKEKKKANGDYKREHRTIIRTKNRLKRLINTNIKQYNEKDKFITFTFSEFQERDEVARKFKAFNRRFKKIY